MPSIEDNKTIARRWIELVNEHKIEEVCQMTAPTWTMQGGPPVDFLPAQTVFASSFGRSALSSRNSRSRT